MSCPLSLWYQEQDYSLISVSRAPMSAIVAVVGEVVEGIVRNTRQQASVATVHPCARHCVRVSTFATVQSWVVDGQLTHAFLLKSLILIVYN